MPIIRKTINTTLAPEPAFAFIADFANNPAWDPGTATAERINPGPVGTGARYRLGVKMRGNVVPMEYVITTHEAPRRVVLVGEGSGVKATDDISFRADGSGTQIEYVADIRLTGLLRLVEPFVGGTFAKIGQQAADGMERALNARARDGAAPAAGA